MSTQLDHLEHLRREARYRRDRLALYRARLYGGRAGGDFKLRELQRAYDGAAARLQRAERERQPAAGGLVDWHTPPEA